MKRLYSSSSPHHTSFVTLLRACAKKNDLHRGNRVHAEILKSGLCGHSAYALVSMYAKCGALAKAQDLLNGLCVRDVFSWTALIAGYVQHGQSQNALICFEQMQQEGLSPDAVTFICILKACATMRAIEKGEELHNELAKQGLLKKNHVLGTALVDMYAKGGALAKAQKVLDELPLRDVIAWNALIAGYAQQGQAQDALKCFERMQHEGLVPNEVTFTFILKVCGSMGALDIGEEIHQKIAAQGLLGNDIVLGNALVDMYTRCGALSKAEQVLEELHIDNIVSWSAVIGAYAQQGLGEEGLNCFERMQHNGLSPDAVTFTSVLKACSSIGAADKGEEIHDEIVKQGLLGNNLVLGTALMDMYVKCGAVLKAQRVLEDLPVRDTICWNSLIAGYAQLGQGHDALVCFEQMQREALSPNAATFTLVLKACGSIGAADRGEQIHDEIVRQGLLRENTVLGNALVDMYVKCGALAKAEQVLEELPGGDVVAWSALIAGYAQEGHGEEALDCFERMQQKGLTPDAVAFTCVLKACGTIKAAEKGKEIHDEIAKQGLLEKNLMLGNALVDMYVKCGALAKARLVLEELPVRDVISWSALVVGYAEQGRGEEALNCFEQMQLEGLSPNAVSFLCVLKACGSIGVPDRGKQVHDEILRRDLPANSLALGTALVDMYAKCGALEKAQEVLDELFVRDVVSWSALIAGYAQHGKGEEALNCYKLMQREGFSPNAVTFICLLKACGSIGATDMGEQIHEQVRRQGLLQNNIALGNALVDMYVKCGALAKAQRVLEELPVRNVISWNTLIAGYAQQGRGQDALCCYEHMQREGLSPEASTLTCILKACGSIGAAAKGAEIHDEITRQGLLVGNDNMLGTALVDMYAKCGALAKAQQVLEEELPVGNVTCWNALIAGYAQQGEGQHVLECIEQMQRQGISPDTVTASCVLKACHQSALVDEGEMFFAYMSRMFGIKPESDHYTHMVDLFAHMGHLDKAVAVIERMPSFDQCAVWSFLLNGCRKWGDVSVGRWAFEHAVHVLRKDRAPCLYG